MKRPHQALGSLAAACVLALALLSTMSAQVIYIEAETAGGQNNTFAQAEDCRQLSNFFRIRGSVHSGNANSDDEWFMFNGVAGACLNLDLVTTQTISTGAAYQLNVWLYDSSQTLVAAWNTVSGSTGASIGIGAYTLPATDTYYIYITEWSVAPNAITQPGIVFTPLSVRGFSVTGATPDSTRNTAGGLQMTGSLYEITVRVSAGNESAFDVFIDCDPVTNLPVCSPSPANVCDPGGFGFNPRFMASAKCPPGGVNVSLPAGSGPVLILPGGIATIMATGPEAASSYTVDTGAGPQVGGVIHAVNTLVARNGEAVSRVDICVGSPVCLDICGPTNFPAGPADVYLTALSDALMPPLSIFPFLSPLELDVSRLLFQLTFPTGQLPPYVTGLQGTVFTNQVCFNLPPGLTTVPVTLYMQVVTVNGALQITGLSPLVALDLVP